MSMRRQYKLIWWLLPLLALRGLVPVGFMLDMSHGDVAMVVCPGHLPGTSESGADHGQPSPKLCPFAVAAAAGPTAFVPGIVSFVAVSLDNTAPPSVTETGVKALHAHLIRGPPALS
jgi:hypothetical protein